MRPAESRKPRGPSGVRNHWISRRFGRESEPAAARPIPGEAIRTAVLIDDQFPNYIEMGNAPGDFSDAERAKSLYAFLHGRGLICDIQNWRTQTEADLNRVDKVRKSDLVILDYQLGVGGPSTALSILRHLATSPHFNLVVLYTGDPLHKVSLAAAVAMRGLAPPSARLQPSEEALGLAADILQREEFREVDSPRLRNYLIDGATPWMDELRSELESAGISLAHWRALTDHVARTWIAGLFDNFEPDSDRVLALRCKLDDPETMWIHCGSCFVAIVNKLKPGTGEDEGAFVWRRLGQALRNWRPNLYRLILSDIQNALEQEAVADHETWLDDHLCLGLGLYLLESKEIAAGPGDLADIEGSAQSLIDRFVDLIRRRLASHNQVASRAAHLLEARLTVPAGQSEANENARHVRARELAHYEGGAQADWSGKVLPAVNAFMVSDSFRGSHVTTGTVLRSDARTYWLCASPSCDLEPRHSDPVLLQLIRMTKIHVAPEVFSTGECIAIAGDGGPIILQALKPVSRQPSLKTVYLPQGTRVVRDAEPGSHPTISGWFATGAEPTWPLEAPPAQPQPTAEAEAPLSSDAPVADKGVIEAVDVEAVATEAVQPITPLAPTVFTVVSQLRSAFATRYLMTAGQHLSRVGVDFVDS